MTRTGRKRKPPKDLEKTRVEGVRPNALASSEVRRVVLAALSDEGRIREMPTLHSKFDHLDRKIDFNDILHGLRRQSRSCKPDEFNADEWQWKYEIATQDIEGRDFTIIVALDPTNLRVTIVTRWPDD